MQQIRLGGEEIHAKQLTASKHHHSNDSIQAHVTQCILIIYQSTTKSTLYNHDHPLDRITNHSIAKVLATHVGVT